MTTKFTVHTKETAPENSVALLQGAEKTFGFVPNLIGMMAETTAVTKGYLSIVPISIVSVAIISIALLLFIVSLTATNIIGMIMFVLTGITAKTGIRTHNWKWTSAAGITLIIGWFVIYL